MAENKMIDEMARAMCFQRDSCSVESCTKVNCEKTWIAEKLYNAGYRKQEWISVDERLPEEKQFVIAYDTVTECVRFLVYNSGAHIWTGNIISHWMPLPQPPETKGETE